MSTTRTASHGDLVESWTMHIHEVRFICPKCNNMVSRLYRPYYTIELPHIIDCPCGQSFRVKWQDKTKDAAVTIHIYVDDDISITHNDDEEQ